MVFPEITQNMRCSNNPGYIQLSKALPGKHFEQTIKVSAQIARELKSIDQASEFVKQHISFAPVNQQTNVLLQGVESYYRHYAAEELHAKEFLFKEKHIPALAKAAFSAKYGACSGLSSALFITLMMMKLDRPVSIYSDISGQDHCFTITGDIRQPETAIVVDIWAIFGRPHMLNNSLCQPDPDKLLARWEPGMPVEETMEALSALPKTSSADTILANMKAQEPPHFLASNQHLAQFLSENNALFQQLHIVRNLGVRYQNEDDPQDVYEQVAPFDEVTKHADIAKNVPPCPPMFAWHE